jgi:hypothetical protein
METNELIRTLAADARRPALSLALLWWGAMGLAIILAALVFSALLGPRPDIAAAAQTPRFLAKFVITVALAASALGVARALLRPEESWRKLSLGSAPALVFLAVVVELLVAPAETWADRLVGTNGLACLMFIPLLGLSPLAILLLALRQGAPTRPGVAGAAAGLLAGGIAATFYAAHCTDDSPLFVATWYTLAIGALALLGAAVGQRFLRW